MVGRVVTANAVPEAQCSPDLLKKLDDNDPDKPEPVKLTIPQRQDLLAALKKDGGLDHLKEWPPELAQKAVALLLEFHHIFSLEPNEIGCMDVTEHVIELMKDEPFKERFRRIAPPLVDEACQHIQEMLDSSAIRPSPVTMVQHRGTGEEERWVTPVLHRLPSPQRQNQKGGLPLASYARDHGKHGWCQTLLLHGLEEWVLAGQDGQRVQAVYHLYSREHGGV